LAGLFERGNTQKILLSLRPFPVLNEFLLMNRRPFDYTPLHTGR